MSLPSRRYYINLIFNEIFLLYPRRDNFYHYKTTKFTQNRPNIYETSNYICKISGVDAGVPFYGIPDSINPADVKVPFLGHFALQDDWCTKSKVEKFAQSLEDSGHNNFEVHFYDVRKTSIF